MHFSAAEHAAGQRLQHDFVALTNLCMEMPQERQAEIESMFRAHVCQIHPSFDNWSKDGFLQVAKQISADARQEQHLNKSSAIAKGFLAIWVEAHARQDALAKTVLESLNKFIAAPEQLLYEHPSYGLSPDNPVLCTGIGDSFDFLERLQIDNLVIDQERIGSEINSRGGIVDHYEVSGIFKSEKISLYIDAHANISPNIAPSGFTLISAPLPKWEDLTNEEKDSFKSFAKKLSSPKQQT